jgi:hypothetical protein
MSARVEEIGDATLMLGDCREILPTQPDMLIQRAPPPKQERLFDETADAIGSYNAAMAAIGERVKAGEPVPDFLLSKTARHG